MGPESRFPALSDLRRRAKRRMPHFVWEYLDSATGDEMTQKRNREALDRILFLPSILHGEINHDISVKFLGDKFNLPMGIAPVGMSGLIWPDAERILAKSADKLGFPYAMSSLASLTPEDVAPVLGSNGWYQLYPPIDPDIRRDILQRAKKAGFKTLVLTVDVPILSVRERQTRGGLTQPPKLTPRLALQAARCPTWLNGMRKLGMPRMKLIMDYTENRENLPSTAHVGALMRTSPDMSYLKALRKEWDGPLIVKGVLDPDDIAGLKKNGVDAIWVSNHAGRQFDAAPAAIDMLPKIRAETTLPLVFDSGIETGLDILRAYANGADYVMLGRAWHYALAAIGNEGPAYLARLLTKDLKVNMAQLGLEDLNNAAKFLKSPQK